jgi:putative hydrolase of the HAD superfamily
VLFDLDDTLYPQRRFLFSGFAAVALFVERTAGQDRARVFRVLRDAWRERRGQELQACVERFALPTALLPTLLGIMRGHRPVIRLPRSSALALAALRARWRTGIVTNGDPAIQRRKVDALGLASLVDGVIFAGEHGTGAGKPEAPPFTAALNRLHAVPGHTVFVGNDEACDIAGAKAVGMKTVLFVAGPPCHSAVASTRADLVIDAIGDVPQAVASLMRRT